MRRLHRAAEALVWGAATSLAGAAVGVAVGAIGSGIDGGVVLLSVLYGNVVGFTVLLTSVVVFPRLRGRSAWTRAGWLGLSLLTGAALGTAVVGYLFPLLVLRDVRQAIAVAAINGVLALIIGAVKYVYDETSARLAESLREVERVRLAESRLREEAARAELAALQARINPHFFFNTLNTISSLLEEDPERADRVVHTLAGLFRYTFRVSDAVPVPLREELEFVRNYLGIEQARFGDRLAVTWSVDPAAEGTLVPGLVLQPLVENAVGHGVAARAGGGTVAIHAGLEGGEVVLEVADDGPGTTAPADRLFAEGHGLGNVLRRLETFYRGRGRLEIAAGADGRGTVARVRIPAAGAEAARKVRHAL